MHVRCIHWFVFRQKSCAPNTMQVCFRLTYYQGRAGLVGVDAVVGHASASLGPPDKPLRKSKAKPSKRKAATQKAGGTAQPAGATALIHALTHSLTHSLIRSLTRSLIPICLLLTRSLQSLNLMLSSSPRPDSLTHPRPHSLSHARIPLTHLLLARILYLAFFGVLSGPASNDGLLLTRLPQMLTS